MDRTSEDVRIGCRRRGQGPRGEREDLSDVGGEDRVLKGDEGICSRGGEDRVLVFCVSTEP